MMVNFSTVLNSLRLGEDKNEIIDDLVNYPLLILDDIGMERHTEYALEQMFNVIDSRDRSLTSSVVLPLVVYAQCLKKSIRITLRVNRQFRTTRV